MELVKEKMHTLEYEKIGLASHNEELRTKLVATCAKSDQLRDDRDSLMNDVWEADAAAVHDAR